jgi:hypothetical protein
MLTQHSIEALYRPEHIGKLEVITTLAGVDTMIDALLAGPENENLAQVFSRERPLLPAGVHDHELLAGVDKDRMVGVLAFRDDGNWASLGSEGRGIVLYYITGHPAEFPDRSEIPVDLARQAVKEFLVSGGQRPECVQWQEPKFW